MLKGLTNAARLLFVLAAGVLCTTAQAGLREHFKGRYGAIEIYDASAKLSFRVNPPHLTHALPVCGLENVVIAAAALEKGIIKHRDSKLTWDSLKYPAEARWPSSWQTDQALSQAFFRGTPWYFAELSEKVGDAALAVTLQKLAFSKPGAQPALGRTSSSLALVEWFKRLQLGTLPLSPSTQLALRSALRRERVENKKLYSLGARCQLDEQKFMTWSVGYVLGNKAPVYYVLTAQGKSLADLAKVGPRIRDAALAELKYFP